MKKYFFLLCSLTLACAASAQQTQTIRGTITDAQSKSPLVAATVVLLNSDPQKGTMTDSEGNFRLEGVPVGRQSLLITYIGYKELTLPNLVVNSGKEVVLIIEMEEEVITGKEVVVNAKENKGETNNELVSISGRTFSIDETNRYAGSLGDPSRMAGNFAGVAGGGNDQRNDIVIRGNSPLGMLWRLEGADIPNPNHFGNQGANGGPVSILNNNTLANSDFLTGAWPSEYGAATSGVFDLKMRNGNNEKREHTFQMGFNGVELMTEGPIKKGGASYLLSYRYSTLSLFNKLGFDFGESGIPEYQDFSLKVNLPTKKAGTFSLWGLGGVSATNIYDSQLDSAERAERSFLQDIEFASGMFASGVTHQLIIGKNGYLRSVVSVSGERNITRIDSLSGLNGDAKSLFYLSSSKLFKTSLHTFYNHKFNAKNSLKTGLILSRVTLDMADSVADWQSPSPSGFTKSYDFRESAFTFQVYSNWNFKPTPKLSINTGLHLNVLALNNTYSLEPRLGARYQVNRLTTVSAAYGLHGQAQPLAVYFQETVLPNGESIRTNHDLKYTMSHHFVVGGERYFGSNFRVKAEAYYQYLTNLPVTENPGFFSVVNFGADFGGIPTIDSLVSTGKGQNYGVEVTAEKFFSKGYYFLVTASVFESKYMASDNIWRNTAFSSNYVFNALAGKEITIKDGVLSFGIKGTYAGGRREIPYDLEASIQEQRAVPDFDRAYEKRLPAYFRMDLRIGYKLNRKRLTHEWALDIRNVFNTQNILTRQFDPGNGQIRDAYQIGIFPIPLYRLQF